MSGIDQWVRMRREMVEIRPGTARIVTYPGSVWTASVIAILSAVVVPVV